jgi:GalNAc-alpha-(1->4)-GalNAc-alpha-(1->3)-diNAcBac-PP-undecaprenol alpha-1,4-N-acetyl-D-galactosaminyltransferase
MVPHRRVRIVFVIWSLAGGGAERVASILASQWARRGWDVHIVTLESGVSPRVYELDPAVAVDAVGFDPPIGTAATRRLRLPVSLRLIPAVRRLSPDAVVGFMPETNIKVLIATVGMRVPVFVCERSDPWVNPLPQPWALLRSLLYRRATAVVAQTERAMSYFCRRIQTEGAVIPNPVPPPPPQDLIPARDRARPTRKVISIGRLCQEKRFDRLLSVFATIAPRHPDWSLEIWGEGDLREPLDRLIDTLGIRHHAYLRGSTRRPHACLLDADLFVLTSDTEGFPNALCEAMACGLPVVSVDCPSGPREIVRHGIDGLLTPAGDSDALAAAIDRLMGDAAERGRLAARAPEILDRFSLDSVVARWDRLFARHIPGLDLAHVASAPSGRVPSCVE